MPIEEKRQYTELQNRHAVHDRTDRLEARLERLEKQIVDLQFHLSAFHDVSKQLHETSALEEFRAALATHIPEGAIVLVVSGGDDDLLCLETGRGRHFPQTEDGVYAGYHPASSLAAIAHLEALRADGAEFLAIPPASQWWLEHYDGFDAYIRARYGVTFHSKGSGIVVDLRGPSPVLPSSGTPFRDVIATFRQSFGSDPAILDWDSGMDLTASHPDLVVFTPPMNGASLPYLDATIDIIVTRACGEDASREARRVARGAVVFVDNSGDILADFRPSMSVSRVEWKPAPLNATLPSATIIVGSTFDSPIATGVLSALADSIPSYLDVEVIVVPTPSPNIEADGGRRTSIPWRSVYPGASPTEDIRVKAAHSARGDILIFLAPTAIVLTDWLLPILELFRDRPDAGVCGGRLLYRDGRLYEAGARIEANGRVTGIGSGDYHNDRPVYRSVRAVDCCSDALFATRRSLFLELWGSQPQRAPTTQAQSTYCVRAAERGWQIYYQPSATAVLYTEPGSPGNKPGEEVTP